MPDPKASRYLKTHEWIQISGEEGVVGISDHAQKEITDVVFVELPKVGRKVKQGESVAVVESVKAAFDVYAPVSGEIIAVNDAVVQNPGLVNESAHEKGWFYRIRPADPKEVEALMDFAAYGDFLKAGAH